MANRWSIQPPSWWPVQWWPFSGQVSQIQSLILNGDSIFSRLFNGSTPSFTICHSSPSLVICGDGVTEILDGDSNISIGVSA